MKQHVFFKRGSNPLALLAKICMVALGVGLSACGGESKQEADYFDAQLDVVCEKVVIDGDSAIVCDYNRVRKQHVTEIPYSAIASDYELVKLDNDNEDAFLGADYSPIAISENYIGVYCYEFYPFKLFRRSDGKYLRDIGGYGQGPGEYGMVKCAQIDEQHNKIYILPALQKKIFIYDLEGNYLSDIPLQTLVNQDFYLDAENNYIYIASSIGPQHEPFIQMLDLSGNVIQELTSREYDIRGFQIDFGRCNAGAYSLDLICNDGFFYNPNSAVDVNKGIYRTTEADRKNPHTVMDFYCYYIPEENRLSPQFAIKNMEDQRFIYELRSYFVVETTMNTYGVPEEKLKSTKILVDKRTLKGCIFDGVRLPSGILMNWYESLHQCRDGYFLLNIFGSNLKNSIEKMDRTKLSPSEEEELKKLEALIYDGKEDCNVIMIGKLK